MTYDRRGGEATPTIIFVVNQRLKSPLIERAFLFLEFNGLLSIASVEFLKCLYPIGFFWPINPKSPFNFTIIGRRFYPASFVINITSSFRRDNKNTPRPVGQSRSSGSFVVAVEQILVSWVGGKDLVAGQEGATQLGPLAQVLATHNFDRVELLYNYPESQMTGYLEWLQLRTAIPIIASRCSLSSPVNFGEIHLAAEAALSGLTVGNSAQLNILSVLAPPPCKRCGFCWAMRAFLPRFGSPRLKRPYSKSRFPSKSPQNIFRLRAMSVRGPSVNCLQPMPRLTQPLPISSPRTRRYSGSRHKRPFSWSGRGTWAACRAGVLANLAPQ